ncbi:MAG: hypothetical protein RSB77_04635 [Bacilli bacterium]
MKKIKSKKKNSNVKWIIQIVLMAFFISLIFSFSSEIILNKVNTIIGVIILISFILFGVLFDMIGTAVTSADIKPFNSMSARKVKGAKIAVIFKKNADKVSSFCNDVVGDICGIISGSAGVIVAKAVSETINIDFFYVTLILTAIIAALTIGGKAIGKGIAMDNNTIILHSFAKFVSIFYKI